jgi:hypothetical protein
MLKVSSAYIIVLCCVKCRTSFMNKMKSKGQGTGRLHDKYLFKRLFAMCATFIVRYNLISYVVYNELCIDIIC